MPDNLKIEYVPIEKLKPHSRNPRVHPDSAINKLVASIKEYGYTAPVLASQDGIILAGHARVKAAKQAGIKSVPVITLPLSGKKADAYLIADNRLQEETRWDFPMLKELLVELDDGGMDLAVTGFNEKELKDLIDWESNSKEDEIPEPPKKAITKLGDLWILGDHRLLCGDSTNAKDVARLMDGKKADMVFTSPPYNVGIKYESHNDSMEHSDYFKMISGVMSLCFSVLNEGRIIGWNVGVSPKSKPYIHAKELENVGFIFYRHIIWKKTGAQIPLWQNSIKKPMARHYMPNYNHEVIYLFSKNAVQYGAETDMPENISMDVWDISQFQAGGHDHPAAFPVALCDASIRAMTASSEICLEPFSGSGTQFISCEKMGRRCFGMEMDAIYCDVIVERWQAFTGKKAVLETSLRPPLNLI